MNSDKIRPSNGLTRRNFLRGLGASIALPSFASLLPASAFAAETPLATTSSGAPLRMAFLYVPNGVNVSRWTPIGEGSDYQLNETMRPLAGMKNQFQVLSGFEHKNGWAGRDGAGDHARAMATILTGARPRKTGGSDIRAGISVDQVAAKHVGHLTRFASLELSCDGARKSGVCDSGYSCAYQFNMAWRSENTPLAPETNPRLVFERLFGSGATAVQRQRNHELRRQRQNSILDFVMDDAHRLQRGLSGKDAQKLDEYLTGLREIEQRIEKTEQFKRTPDFEAAVPDGIPGAYQEHIRLMMDMLVLAFQTDSTRVATFMLAHDGSNRSFPEIGVSDGHHSISHHQNDADKLERIAKIDLFYAQQFAWFMERLQNTKDTQGGSLLDNSMIVYCSGIADGDRHNHDNLPVILAGHAGGTLNPGRHLALGEKTPMTNLYVSMLQRMGVRTESFGDSNGSVRNI
jgi:hypothetical protein